MSRTDANYPPPQKSLPWNKIRRSDELMAVRGKVIMYLRVISINENEMMALNMLEKDVRLITRDDKDSYFLITE